MLLISASSYLQLVAVDAGREFFIRFPFQRHSPFILRVEDMRTQRPSAQEFLQEVLERMDDLPADFRRRFEEVLKKPHVDRAQAIRQLFEDYAGE